jgi:hypothetical protein
MVKRMHAHAENGGFPEPPAGEPQRLVRTLHPACGTETRLRLPSALSARAVRRVVCEHCEASFECEAVEELRLLSAREAAAYGRPPATPTARASTAFRLPRPPRPALPDLRVPSFDSLPWRVGSVIVAAIAVVAILALIQDGDGQNPAPVADAVAGGEPANAAAGAAKPATTQARFISEPGFELALPPGWERIAPEDGAAFAARTAAGNAEAKLWIEDDPSLTFGEFEQRSLAALESLAGTAEVVERAVGPTLGESRVRLRADAPAGSGVSAPYDVTLRAAGPYRYHLSTALLPGASEQAAAGVELIHGSFQPASAQGVEIATAPNGAPQPEAAP